MFVSLLKKPSHSKWRVRKQKLSFWGRFLGRVLFWVSLVTHNRDEWRWWGHLPFVHVRRERGFNRTVQKAWPVPSQLRGPGGRMSESCWEELKEQGLKEQWEGEVTLRDWRGLPALSVRGPGVLPVHWVGLKPLRSRLRGPPGGAEGRHMESVRKRLLKTSGKGDALLIWKVSKIKISNGVF